MILYIYPLFENQVFAVGKIACADSDDKKQHSLSLLRFVSRAIRA
jgi:hypothetical protein